MIKVPESLLPTVFDQESPGYVPPRIASDYLGFREARTGEKPQSILEPLKNKLVVIGVVGALALGLTAAYKDKATLGGAIRDIFPDDSPPITHPVNKIVDNHG